MRVSIIVCHWHTWNTTSLNCRHWGVNATYSGSCWLGVATSSRRESVNYGGITDLVHFKLVPSLDRLGFNVVHIIPRSRSTRVSLSWYLHVSHSRNNIDNSHPKISRWKSRLPHFYFWRQRRSSRLLLPSKHDRAGRSRMVMLKWNPYLFLVEIVAPTCVSHLLSRLVHKYSHTFTHDKLQSNMNPRHLQFGRFCYFFHHTIGLGLNHIH